MNGPFDRNNFHAFISDQNIGFVKVLTQSGQQILRQPCIQTFKTTTYIHTDSIFWTTFLGFKTYRIFPLKTQNWFSYDRNNFCTHRWERKIIVTKKIWLDVEKISIPKTNNGYFILLNRRLPVTNIIRKLNKRKLEVSKEKN